LATLKNQYNQTAYFYRRCDTYIQDFYGLIGRGIVLHSSFDHGAGASCDQGGSSGARILVGVIGVANPAVFANNSNVPLAAISLFSFDNTFDSSVSCAVAPNSTSSHSDATKCYSTFVFICGLVLALFFL